MTSPETIDESRLKSDSQYRLEHACDVMGFDEADWERIQRSEPVLRQHLRELVENLYERFMEYEPTAQFYRDEKDNPDPEAYEHRVDGFVLWFERIFDWEKNERYFDYLRDVGRIHTRNKGFSHMHVNRFYMLPTFGILFSDLMDRLGEHMDDTEELARTASAWQRFFLLQLDLMQQAYDEPPSSNHRET